MTSHAKKTGLIALITFLLIAYMCSYTIHEGRRGILLFLGKIVEDSKTGQPAVKLPGLHFKLPFLHQLRVFDVRLQTKDIDESLFVTAEKKDVLVNYYIKWRIADISLYFKRTGGNAQRAEVLLEQQLNDGLRAEFGKRKINEVVSSERSDVMTIIQKQANEGAKSLGLDVVDVRIKRIDLPPQVSKSVYLNMGAERERIAKEHRSSGTSQAMALRAQADRDVAVLLAESESKAKQLRGEGDAIAAQLYANAYMQDPDFYQFWRSLAAYQASFSKRQDVLILKPDGQFFKYFNRADVGTHQ